MHGTGTGEQHHGTSQAYIRPPATPLDLRAGHYLISLDLRAAA